MNTYERIKRSIINGELKPGEKLREERLSSELNVSRTPVREALKKLEVENLVVYYQNRGSAVQNYSEDDILNAYNLRGLLEGYAASLAAYNYIEGYKGLIRDANEKYRMAVQQCLENKNEETILGVMKANRLFHDIILEMSNNNQISTVLSSVVALPLVYQSFYWYTNEEIKLSVVQHINIESAIKRRDMDEAKTLMTSHIYHGRNHVLHHFNEIMKYNS
ncbi:GntR family transcriptional regulator [Salicibibacter cibarius]|uniref:GntR family transcriptional regulator n=1 Tax=Salicibibacter cibarius TaxID=2743000 RepID=A0A7T7CDB5_9BACI|nr:GntR family transcriptional regulator [Salicibibacter cibarius]QQK77808.1 GntR family transcriptional regulator [Salicibibacter cibarius]